MGLLRKLGCAHTMAIDTHLGEIKCWTSGKIYRLVRHFRNVIMYYYLVLIEHGFPYFCAVGLLQATHVLRVGLQERNLVDSPEDRPGSPRHGLHDVEQQPGGTMLRLQVVQGRDPGQPQEGVAATGSDQHVHPRVRHPRLLRRLLRSSEQHLQQLLKIQGGIRLNKSIDALY